MVSKDLLLDRLDVGLKVAQKIRQQIYEDLHYDKVMPLMDSIGFLKKNVVESKEVLLTKSIQADEDVFGELYAELKEAKRRLNYDEPVDLYVCNTPEINAHAQLSHDENENHMIVLTAGLVNTCSDRQVQSIIGHELGHLMNEDTTINRLLFFFYPDSTTLPAALSYKLSLLAKFNELRADRCGYIACGDLNDSVLAFLYMTSGVTQDKLSCNAEMFLKRCRKNVKYIQDNPTNFNKNAHPEIPLRVKGLEIFAKLKDEQELANETLSLISSFCHFSEYEWDLSRIDAIAGWLVASADGKVTVEEIDTIYENVAGEGHIFPEDLLDDLKVLDRESLVQGLISLMKKREVNPKNVIVDMLKIVVSDQEINKEEMTFVRSFAKQVGIDESDFNECFAKVLRAYYQPIISLRSKNVVPFF